MSIPQSETVVRIAYSDQGELLQKLRAVASRFGMVLVKAAPERLTVGQLAKRIGRPVSTVSRSLSRPTCPEFECRRGKKRIVWLEPNDRLIAFLESIPTKCD